MSTWFQWSSIWSVQTLEPGTKWNSEEIVTCIHLHCCSSYCLVNTFWQPLEQKTGKLLTVSMWTEIVLVINACTLSHTNGLNYGCYFYYACNNGTYIGKEIQHAIMLFLWFKSKHKHWLDITYALPWHQCMLFVKSRIQLQCNINRACYRFWHTTFYSTLIDRHNVWHTRWLWTCLLAWFGKHDWVYRRFH